MAISPEQAQDQKRFEQPPWDYCRRLAEEMKAFPRKHRLAEFRAEVVVEQTQVLSAALEDSWIKSFHHSDQPKRIDASNLEELAERLHGDRVWRRVRSIATWMRKKDLSATFFVLFLRLMA